MSAQQPSAQDILAAGIIGVGSYLPERIVTNANLELMVNTSDEWITTRTGISKRHIADPNEATSDLAAKAAKNALQSAMITAEDIDMILVATFTPDAMIPSTASQVQNKIGAVHASVLDIEAACSGFVYGLVIAQQFIQTGAMKNILVIGAEVVSRYLDWKDRTTCVLFGDGAGAAVVSRTNKGSTFLGFHLGADGSSPKELLMLIGSGSINRQATMNNQSKDHIIMDGKAIYKFGIDILPEIVTTVTHKSHVKLSEVDLIIPHQANKRIIESAAERLGLSMEKFYVNIDRRANTSAASIPIAMVDARNEGRLKNGDIVVLAGFGAGLTWGSVAMKF
jgi:3-oxoacyl-[acyl-carrier-protein] synthase-3